MTYYDDISEGYEELHEEEQLKKIRVIKKFFNPNKTHKLLDVGCGTGLTTQPWDCKRFGIDPAKKLLQRAKQIDKIEYKLAFAEKIPYSDNYFDHVISITAMQNFSDIKKGLQEIGRVGKNSFVLSALKKSSKINQIRKLIYELFNVTAEMEEDKDIIFFAN